MKFNNEILYFIFKSWPHIVSICSISFATYESIKLRKITAKSDETLAKIQSFAPITQMHYNQLLDIFSEYLDKAARYSKSDNASLLKEYRAAYLKSRMLIPNNELHNKMDEVNTYLLDQKNSNIKSELEFTNMLADISDTFSLFLDRSERNK